MTLHPDGQQAGCSQGATTPIGDFARTCQREGSHEPFTVSPHDTAVDRRVKIGQGGGPFGPVVIERSRAVLMERCRMIVR